MKIRNLLKLLLLTLCVCQYSQAETVNRCYNPARRSTVFTEQPCEKLGLIHQGKIEGANMNRADPVPTQNQTYVAPVQVVNAEQAEAKVVRMGPSASKFCEDLEQEKNRWTGLDEFSRKRFADLLFNFNSKCR